MHNDLVERFNAQGLNMKESGLRQQRSNGRGSSRVRGEVLVLPSNFVPGLGSIREDFILVIMN